MLFNLIVEIIRFFMIYRDVYRCFYAVFWTQPFFRCCLFCQLLLIF